MGNHGGGPTKANIASILRVNAEKGKPAAIFSSPDAFFDAVRPKAGKLPVVAEELQYHSRGCYTAVSSIKQHNRIAENMLLQAEKLSTMATRLLGMEYPAADLEYGWKRVLFNQFHDIMAGTSIRPACDDAVDEYLEAEALAQRAARRSMGRLSAQLNVPGEGRPVVVYNTLSWERTEVVEAEVSWINHDDSVHMVDEAGNQVPFQVLHTNISGRGTTVRVAFEAAVPACGYRAYRMLQGPGEPVCSPFSVGPTFVESDVLRLELDADSGYLTRLLHKPSGADLLAGPANVPLVMSDPSDTWSHGVPSFRDEIGRFGGGAVEVVEAGPVRVRLMVTSEWGPSTLVQDIRISRGSPRVDVVLTVDYHGEHEFLKLAFPTELSDVTATYEAAYGFAVRAANGTEEPAQKWADVSGTLPSGSRAGLAVLNDAKYGYDVLEGELRLSVLRTPIYCFHDPAVVDARKRYEFTDQGVQRFTYALLPHGGDWREGDVVRQAQQVNQPCLVREEPAHKGKLAACYSFASAEGSVIIEVVKRHEDGDAVVLRAYETAGRETLSELKLAGVSLGTLQFRPCEIKTLVVDSDGVREVNLLEW